MAASWQVIQDKDDARRPRFYVVRNDPRYERPMRLASFHSQVPLDVARDVLALLEAKLEARLSAPRGRE